MKLFHKLPAPSTRRMGHYCFVCMMLLSALHAAAADNPLIRYVKTDGKFSDNGLSWATAKNNLQDAINELRDYMTKNNIDKGGYVYVATGEYSPTESTEETGGGALYASFKLYAGISVYGGFAGTETAADPFTLPSLRQPADGAKYDWEFKYPTVLKGTLAGRTPSFAWNESRQQYTVAYPGNSYHVVWFATAGFTGGRADSLKQAALLDGFTVQHGYASNSSSSVRSHTAYGGGVYLVKNGTVSRCIVTECSASRSGGGIYMDGGGLVEKCRIYRNQSLGIGILFGYGGGVCLDQGGTLTHSVVTDNVGRMGGGVALRYDAAYTGTAQPAREGGSYAMGTVTCVVANNTSTTEAGGIYMDGGGVLNRLTVVNNRCNGGDSYVNGIHIGRSAGIYANGPAYVFNTVCWGGYVANVNIPFAARSVSGSKVYVYNSAFSMHDLIDWSAAVKSNVLSLETENSATQGETKRNYALFMAPSANSGACGAGADTPDWQPNGASSMRERGVHIIDLPAVRDNAAAYHSVYDLAGQVYKPRTTLGAYVALPNQMTPYVEGGREMLFVDPDWRSGSAIVGGNGDSWDNPVVNLNDALDYFASNGKTGEIHVKEGDVSTAGYYLNDRLRSSSINMVSGVTVYGGYRESLTGTDRSDRNPAAHPTTIDGNLGGAYENSVSHLVLFRGVSNAVLDGFCLYNGNASSTYIMAPAVQCGAGVLCGNAFVGAQPVDMTGNELRNCVLANCTARRGAAVYVESGAGTVELKLTNCVIHNNAAADADGHTVNGSGVAMAVGQGAALSLNHCTVVANVGYGLCADAQASVRLDNTALWANASQSADRIESADPATLLITTVSNGGTLSGTYNLTDAAPGLPADLPAGDNNQAVFTLVASDSNCPDFVNATRNIGVTTTGHVTNYGGRPDFTPGNMNPMVNAAADGNDTDTDLTTVNQRLYGGQPDVGALEDTNLPLKGRVIYVRDYGDPSTPGGDGSSWAKAINGNSADAVYTNNHSFQGYDLEIYATGTQLTGLQWAVDEAYYRSLKKASDCKTPSYTTKTLTGSTIQLTLSAVDTTQKVQVWVAEGTYTRRDGFFMRDGVDVLGGFPPQGNPGESERAPKTYETIIQTLTAEQYRDTRLSKLGLDSNDDYEPIDKGVQLANVKYSDQEHSAETLLAQYAVDASTSTYYHSTWSNGSEDKTFPHFIAFAMDAAKAGVRQIRLTQDRGGNSGTLYQASEFEVYTTNDATAWSNIQNNIKWSAQDLTGWTKQTIAAKQVDGTWKNTALVFSAPQTFQYVAVVFTKSSSGSNFLTVSDLQLTADEWMENSLTQVVDIPYVHMNSSTYELNSYSNAYASKRVLTQPYPYYEVTSDTELSNIAFNPFTSETTWNGFTIQHGIVNIDHGKDGGGAAALRENGVLENCVLRDNLNYSGKYVRGGAVFCNKGVLKNCVLENNTAWHSGDPGSGCFGGAIYMRAGTVYNSCFRNNTSYYQTYQYNWQVAGSAVYFENGTFFNNTLYGNVGYAPIGTGGWFNNGLLRIYNTLFYGNVHKGGDFDIRVASNNGKTVDTKVTHCHWEKGLSTDFTLSENSDNVTLTADPFVDAAQGDLHLKKDAQAINAGREELVDDAGKTVNLSEFYDADYTDRIKDCRVDIGAYELDEAYAITGTADAEGRVNYYVTQTGYGVRSAASPDNAACWEKLQLVLDAAGRYKADHPDTPVRVCLAGDNDGTGFSYRARRSTAAAGDPEFRNPRSNSLLVPRGVEVWGGYNDTYTDTGGKSVAAFAERDIRLYPTTLSGLYQAEDMDVNVYHVVTFTEDVFTIDQIKDASRTLSAVTDRTILDGLFIEGGQATGETAEHRGGGAARVTAYAHVRNCILRHNTASEGGGALYLLPEALVSGCIFTDNEADEGGAVYMQRFEGEGLPAETDRANIYTCTFVNNTAVSAGGGVWFSNNLRLNSSVLWRNSSNEQANVWGQTDPYLESGNTAENYPVAYCAVENVRLPGLNNLSVSPDADKGVRWVDLAADPYYMIQKISVLAHAGMPVSNYQTLMADGTLPAVDLAGAQRVFPENGFIEIGARAYGGVLCEVPVADNLMTRLFVVPADQTNVAAQTALANSGDPLYSLSGSSMGHPMQQLDDALEYIRKARTLSGTRNTRFEIFVAPGTFYPYRTVTGTYGFSRSNTFLIPEGVTLVGGVDPSTMYCQAASGTVTVAGISLQGQPTDTILNRRAVEDQNANDVVEPWEMKYQTILSGKVVNDEKNGGVYHVLTCLANTAYVGNLPDTDPDTQAGMPVVLDGLRIQEGEALGDYETDDASLDYAYFRGGGMLVDGSANNLPDSFEDATSVRNIPLVLRRCLFVGNKAGHGGALSSNGTVNIYSCSFVGNESRGGTGDINGLNVTYEGRGGAIENAGLLTALNTLFANNEASAGTLSAGASASGHAGFGGAVYSAAGTHMELLNCNVVRNRATAYPGLYTQAPNTASAQNNAVVNTVFWGNEAPADTLAINFNAATPDASAETMWFCAYETGWGRTPENNASEDLRVKPFSRNAKLTDVFGTDNCNILLSKENLTVEGPNFMNPSLQAGVAGYMEAADWMACRQNNLTDNGWTYLQQTISKESDGSYSCTFDTDAAGKYIGSGIYYTVAYQQEDIWRFAPMGEDPYMKFVRDGLNSTSATGPNMLRVSKDPNPTHNKTYIDIGLYEYQHVMLSTDVDILWVSEREKPEFGLPDGSSWYQPTSDLQRAIETLLANRNGNHKEIRILEGYYAPIYTLDNNRQAFQISTGSLNSSVFGTDAMASRGVASLTIKGGYSDELPDVRDVAAYPTYLRAAERSGVDVDRCSNLFVVEDAYQWVGTGNNALQRDSVIPIQIDGVSFCNVLSQKDVASNGFDGASAFYYKEQSKSGTLAKAPTCGAPKVKLSRCTFLLNGADVDVPAVLIGAGGGQSLLVNDLFHSNAGRSLDAADTHVVNCTFALNGGNVLLTQRQDGCDSRLYNSVLWRNGGDSELDTDCRLAEIRGNAVTDWSGADTEGNEPLADENENVIDGPNFANPMPEATGAADKALRDFSLRPSVKLLNRASAELYGRWVGPGTGADQLATLTDSLDLSGHSRSFGQSIDRGAYEYQALLQRVVYVDPTRTVGFVPNDGKSWATPFENGRLQDAVDLAAVYASANTKTAYVFAKGGKTTDEQLTFRNGVSVYGSIASDAKEVAAGTDADEDARIDEYINYIKSNRPGLLEPTTRRTEVGGIRSGNYYDMLSLIDGFDVSAGSALDAPLVRMENARRYNRDRLVLRNCLIHDTQNTRPTVSATPQASLTEADTAAVADASVVSVNSGILYNVLVRGCQASAGNPVVSVRTPGRVVNATVVVGADDKALLSWREGDADNRYQVVNTLTWNTAAGSPSRVGIQVTHDGSGNATYARSDVETHGGYAGYNTAAEGYPFARYLQPTSVPAVPAHLTANANLWYQLEELSPSIDACDAAAAWTEWTGAEGTTSETEWKQRIDFANDRDVLGNPRRMFTTGETTLDGMDHVDRGCFETWRVGSATTTVVKQMALAGRRYPHEGSVVYIQPGSVLQGADDLQGAERLHPGYLLLGEGASLYGEGADLRLDYLAQDVPVDGAWKLTALPYAWRPGDVVTRAYSSDAGTRLTPGSVAADGAFHTYDGLGRSAWNYRYKATDSELWQPQPAADAVAANSGVLYNAAESCRGQVHRFTGYAAEGTYAYEENGTPKTVTLTQYNSRPTDGTAHFTYLENMGWNLAGLPYLVAAYAPGADNAPYPMHLPHVLYTMNGTTGAYEVSESWRPDVPALACGEGWFVQTATLEAAEALRFAFPHYSGTPAAVRALRPGLALTGAGGSDAVALTPKADADAAMDYAPGADALKWPACEAAVPQIYVSNAAGTRLALASAVPEGQEIAVGIHTGAAGTYSLALTDRAAYAAYGGVWLTDRKTGRSVNLLEGPCNLTLDGAGDYGARLTLRFGGVAPGNAVAGSAYSVTIKDGLLVVEGLKGGERLAVYDAQGRMVCRAVAGSERFTHPVTPGVYVVRIDGKSYKVR